MFSVLDEQNEGAESQTVMEIEASIACDNFNSRDEHWKLFNCVKSPSGGICEELLDYFIARFPVVKLLRKLSNRPKDLNEYWAIAMGMDRASCQLPEIQKGALLKVWNNLSYMPHHVLCELNDNYSKEKILQYVNELAGFLLRVRVYLLHL